MTEVTLEKQLALCPPSQHMCPFLVPSPFSSPDVYPLFFLLLYCGHMHACLDICIYMYIDTYKYMYIYNRQVSSCGRKYTCRRLIVLHFHFHHGFHSLYWSRFSRVTTAAVADAILHSYQNPVSFVSQHGLKTIDSVRIYRPPTQGWGAEAPIHL